jgi:hypothetical protein
MHKHIGHRILIIGLRVGLGLLAATAVANAQQYNPTTPTQDQMYCSGVISDKSVPNNLYVISGEDSTYKVTYDPGEFVYINAAQGQGIKIGDQFDVIRPVSEPMPQVPWFKYQATLTRAMGTRYADIGRLRIVHMDAKTSTAIVDMGCDVIQRGDLVRPFAARPIPQFHNIKLDPFAPPSGKKTAMVVSAKDYQQLTGTGKIIYVNLGSEQGVRIGDYFRVFRYQGSHAETNYAFKDSAYRVYGFGSTPLAYEWNDLPRQVLGEGIVLRVGPNSSTVLVTNARREIFAGDYVEVE